MAIYSFNRKITKRTEADGTIKNAVFAAAYYRGEKRTCYKTEETKDFSAKKTEVLYVNCILPDDAPEWAVKLRNSQVKDENGQYGYDKTGAIFSEYVWELIEHIEKRYDSQLYVRDIIAIPIELNQQEAIELVREFAKNELAVGGVFCEVAIHWDLVNPHAHFMRPMDRKMTEEGFSSKLRTPRSEIRAQLLKHREAWATYANRKLAEAGHQVRIDHRSHKDRGIDLKPTVKVGKATYMYQTEHQELRIAQNQQIRAENYKKIQDDPTILATKISQERQEFTVEEVKNELARYVVNDAVLETLQQEENASQEKTVREIIARLKERHSVFGERELKAEVLKTVEHDEQFQAIVSQVAKHEEIIELGLGEDGRTHYVTREAFALEMNLAKSTESLANKNHFLVSDQVLADVVQKYGLNPSQAIALRHITHSANLSLVVGVAGSGKTYMLQAAREVWEHSGYRVHGIAFSGRAAAGLENDAGIRSQTIAKFTQRVANGSLKLTHKDILVMDEMGMTSLDDMANVIKIVEAGGSAFKGIGDIEQTQPVGRGAPMRAMLEQAGHVVMDVIVRQKVEWQAEATLNMERGQGGLGLDAYQQREAVCFAASADETLTALVEKWYEQYKQYPSLDALGHEGLKEHLLIAHRNDTVSQLNTLARARLIGAGIIEEGQKVMTMQGALSLAAGDRIVFGVNYDVLKIKNGHFATVLDVRGTQLTVKIDGDKARDSVVIDTRQYNAISYGYAATVHKVQGTTVDYVFEYIDGAGWNRHNFLVGSSRHRYGLMIMADHETFGSYEALRECVDRYGLKDHIFDFPLGFSLRRGLKAQSVAERAAHFVRRATTKLQDTWRWLTNYQVSIEAQKEEKTAPFMVDERRQQAIIVADFCDRRIEIAKKIAAIQEMPGYTIETCYENVPRDEDIVAQRLYVYLHEEKICCVAKNADGVIERFSLTENKALARVLSDPEGLIKFGKNSKAAVFTEMAQYGYMPLDEEEKTQKAQELYHLKLANSELAEEIQANYDDLKIALDKNRIGREAITASILFGQRYREMKDIAAQHKIKQFYSPVTADQVISNLRDYYGHMIAVTGTGKPLYHLLYTLQQQAYQHRYEIALLLFGEEQQENIQLIKRYLDFDCEILQALNDPEQTLENVKARLHDIRQERNKLAAEIHGKDQYAAIVEHFGVNKQRLGRHQAHHNAQALVNRFSELSNVGTDRLYRQILAARIKQRPSLYGRYVKEFLKEGWKTIHLDNWRYEKKKALAAKSQEFKASERLIRRYMEAAYTASQSWQSAMKRRERRSPNTSAYIRRAQGLSWQRDKFAYELIRDVEKHSGALAFERIDLQKLVTRAKHYEYFVRYCGEKSEVKKLRMAHHIAHHMQGFGHAVGLHRLYEDIKERARHYDYLHRMKRAPDNAVKTLIRLVEGYEQKRLEASEVWRHYQRLEKQHQATVGSLYGARHLLYQRNAAAFAVLEHCTRAGLSGPQIHGVSLDVAALEKASQQHIAYQRVLTYLNTEASQRGALAQEILADRAGYHFIDDKGLDFKVLQKEATAWINQQSTVKVAVISPEKTKHWDVERIQQALALNVEETYRAVFGDPKERSASQWRYANGLIVTLKGQKAGMWYSFTEGIGGGPVKAIQHQLGLSFPEALAYGAKLAGLTETQAVSDEAVQVKLPRIVEHKALSAIEEREREQRIASAASIWQGITPIQGTVAERYFVQHRKVATLESMEIAYWPVGRKWISYENGQRQEKVNKIPAAVVAIRNAAGELTGVQRIYLDPQTAGKNTRMKNAKVSKGIVKGGAGIIQYGQASGRLYIAEGPETCASIALSDREATVLASLGVSNIAHLEEVIRKLAPREVILAADNDGLNAKTRKITEQAFSDLQEKLANTGIAFRLVFPSMIAGKKKVDWNDVLMHYGAEELRKQLMKPDEFKVTRVPWGEHFYPEVVVHQKAAYRREHPEYVAAKQGDITSAIVLAEDMVSPSAVQVLKEVIGERKACLVAVTALEARGQNAIPDAFANVLASRLDLPIDRGIYQVNSPKRTGQDAEYRMAQQPMFTGEVVKGQAYIIVDDHLSMGATIANLKGYIESQGGEVILATTISAKNMTFIVPDARTYAKIVSASGNNPEFVKTFIQKEYGHEFEVEHLTRAEIGHLAKRITYARSKKQSAEIEKGSERAISPISKKEGTGAEDLVKHPALYYPYGQPIPYTLAEQYLRENQGLAGVDLSEIRYHENVRLPHQTETLPAILLPAVNAQGEIKAEMVMYLNREGTAIQQTAIRGEPKGCVVTVQATQEAVNAYITDNLLDAKAIAMGNTKANVYISLDHYRDLHSVGWILESLPKGAHHAPLVFVASDNFDASTEKNLYDLTTPWRELGYEVCMAKGRLSDDYTHVSIHDALIRQEKIRGDNFIQQRAIKPPPVEKLSLKEKIKRAVGGKPTAQVIKLPRVKRPEKMVSPRYYVSLPPEKLEYLRGYFAAVDKLQQQNDYASALEVAREANSAYSHFAKELATLRSHAQPIARTQAGISMEAIRERVLQGSALGLADFHKLFTEIATPRLDTHSQMQFLQIAEKMAQGVYDKDYEQAVASFVKEKAELLKLWKGNDLMPGTGHGFIAKDAAALLAGKMDRDRFLGVIRYAEQDARTHTQSHHHQKSHKKGEDDDRSRGGRSF